MSEHTPGPWRWTLPEGPDDPYQLEGNIEYADMNPILVAFDCGCKADHKTGRCPMGPDPEDRALISAAPELLKVLVKAAIPLEAIHASVHWELAEELKDAVADAISVIRKVVAKAEGRANE